MKESGRNESHAVKLAAVTWQPGGLAIVCPQGLTLSLRNSRRRVLLRKSSFTTPKHSGISRGASFEPTCDGGAREGKQSQAGRESSVMSFILRASIVIGLLAFFASKRDQAVSRTDGSADAKLAVSKLLAAAAGVPAEARDRVVRTGLQDISRRFASARPSQDTLSEADRRLPWRGIAAR